MQGTDYMRRGIAFGRLPVAALVAVGLAAAGNALIYSLALVAGLIPDGFPVSTPGGESPFNVILVAVSSAVGVAGAAITLAAIGRFSGRPVRLFRVIATVVLLLSFATPFTIPGAPLTMVFSLEVMHVLAWAVCIGPMVTMSSERSETESRQV